MATAKKPAPASTSSNGPRPRILRIGVLLGGTIVEERLIRERTTVTIGQSMKNTFSVPVELLPLEFPMFVLDGDRYSLRFLKKMDGRLSDGGQVNTLEALKSRGATQVEDGWQVPLSESSRGKIQLGDLTVLFQFVTEPPRQPRPMLPASVRGTFADRIDPQLAIIMGVSILVHFGFVVYSLTVDPERPQGIAERAYDLTFKPDAYDVDVKPPPKPPETKPTDKGADKKAATDAGKEPKKPADKAPAKPAGGDAGGRKQDDQVAMQEQANAFANALTGDDGESGSEGGMSDRRPGGDLKEQLNAASESGRQVAIGGGSGRGSRDGDARVGTGSGPGVSGPGSIASAGGGPKGDNSPAGRVSLAPPKPIDQTTLTPDVVFSKIQSAYMAGLKRCYKEYLKKDSAARGKVALSFTVNASGRVVNGSANGFAGEVDQCIGGQMSTWRFPIPKDKDGEPTDSNFELTLQLVPD